MKNIHMRRAIAMIELIFAIVVMGIVLLSAPMIIGTATKSGYVALQQESISVAASEIGMILTYHWDENNTDLQDTSPILVTNGSITLNEDNTTGRRKGTPRSSKRSFFSSLAGGTRNASLKSNFSDGDLDDID